MNENESKRQDKFEASVNRLVRFADENRNYVVGGVVALLLVAGAIYFKISTGMRLEREAWAGLSESEGTGLLREKWNKYKKTDAGFFLAHEFAHRLWGEQLNMQDGNDDGNVESRVTLLDEGIAVLQEAMDIHEGHAMIPQMESMLGSFQAERDWVDKNGAAILAARSPSFEPKPEKLKDVERVADEPGQLPRVVIKTEKGDITVDLYEDDAPNHVANFIALTLGGFYDGLIFHRVEDWVTQSGCPDGNGMGGPGYRIKAEINERKHDRGAFGMARSQDMDSAGSQFYFVKKANHEIDEQYTIFGKVVAGMDVVDRIQIDDKLTAVTVVRMRDKEYKPDVLHEE